MKTLLATSIMLSSLAFADAHAQAARIGRLPLLAPPGATDRCRSAEATPALRQSGIARLLMLRDSAPSRLLSIGLSARGTPQLLSATMSSHEGRRGEGETAMIFFDPDGSVNHGQRMAFTSGVPSRRDEDRRGGLLPADTAQARALMRAIMRLCAP